MHKPCRAFPSEYQYEYNKKQPAARKPYPEKLHWDDEEDGTVMNKEEAEKLLRMFLLDRYNSLYRIQYKDRSKKSEPEEVEEDLGVGKELLAYLRKLYFSPPKETVPRVPYTSTRVYGFSSPETLRAVFSSYQDSYGRVGGSVIMKNMRKMVATAKRTRILTRLAQQMEAEGEVEQVVIDESPPLGR